MKINSMKFWGLVMIVMGGIFALIFRSRPIQNDAGKYINQDVALYSALAKLSKDVDANPNASSVTVHFQGPHPLKKDESEFWSYNRRLDVLVGFFYIHDRAKEGKKDAWRYGKIVCDKTDDTRLKTLSAKGTFLAVSPEEYGCRAEDPREIAGKLPDELVKKSKP